MPPTYDPSRAAPVVLALHCLTCNHDVYLSSSWPGLQRLADERGALIVTPLAYGEGGHYEGAKLDENNGISQARENPCRTGERIYGELKQVQNCGMNKVPPRRILSEGERNRTPVLKQVLGKSQH